MAPHTYVAHIPAASPARKDFEFTAGDYLTTGDDSVSQKTESVHSDEPSPPSSEIIIPTTRFDIKHTFPSILIPSRLIRIAAAKEDVDTIYILVGFFASCIDNIILSIDQLPDNVHLSPNFEMGKSAVVFNCEQFVGHASQLKPEKISKLSKIEIQEVIRTALELMDVALVSLKGVMEYTRRILTETKPLPTVPHESSTDPNPDTIADLVAEVMTEATGGVAPADGDTSSSEEEYSLADRVENDDDNKISRVHKKSIIARLMQVRKKSNLSLLSYFTTGAPSSLTLTNPPTSITDATKEKSQLEDPESEESTKRDEYCGLRISLVFPDPENPDVDVQMPLPACLDDYLVRLDDHGDVKAATLISLVRLITSREAVTNPEFTKTFFTCFRFFSSPIEVYQLLVARFEEEPGTGLTPAQLRVWPIQALKVRMRVVKIFCTWVEDYWRHDMDEEVFHRLIAFVFERASGHLPDPLLTKLVVALSNRIPTPHSGGECRVVRARRQLELLQLSALVDEPVPTGFEITLCPDTHITLQISHFDSRAGRQELARQITILASEHFTRVDPEDAVIYWRGGKDMNVAERVSAMFRLEELIAFWVAVNILNKASLEERANMMGFWLDVAMYCIELRNYSSAYSIFSGLTSSPVHRLKRTITAVESGHKENYLVLQEMFNCYNNMAGYRKSMSESKMPTVPLIMTFIHDIQASDVVAPLVSKDGNTGAKNLINLSGYRTVMKTIRAMEIGHIQYKLTQHKYIQPWLMADLRLFDEVSYSETQKILDKKSSAVEKKSIWMAESSQLWKMGTSFDENQPNKSRMLSSLTFGLLPNSN